MHSSSEGEEADIAVVSSLALGNELDFVVGAGGPWTLQACGVPLFIPLIDNLNSSKIDIVYFLVPKVWIEKLKLEINHYADNLNSKIEIIFVELEETVKFLGDALRYFMSYNILNNNFLLISNPMITTANFDHIMKSFKDSCAQDSAIVITPYIYEMPTIVDQLEYITSIIHNKKHIIKMKVASKNSELVLPLEYFVQNEEFEINMKVPKCPILACKPSVLIYFEDNFDCETIEGLVNWIVSKEEIIQQKVEYKKLEHYTVPIHCCEMYHQIVRDLMCFFLPKYHPLNYAYYDNKAQYSAMNKSINIITEKKSKISKESTIVKGFLFLNSNSVIGSNCKIESTMIMKNCIIEDNCSIKNCIIMDNCHIKNDSKLENLIIGHGNEISLSKLDGLNLKLIPPEKIVDSTSITQIMEVMTKTLATFNISLDQLDISEYQEINYGIESDFKAKSQMDQSKEFVTKCVELLKKSRSNNAVHNAAIDIVVVRNDYKIDHNEYSRLVFESVCTLLNDSIVGKEGCFSMDDLRKFINDFTPFLKSYIKDCIYQTIFLEMLANFAEENESFCSYIQTIFYLLYESNVIEEEEILSWYEDLDESEFIQVYEKLSKFIEFLGKDEDEE